MQKLKFLFRDFQCSTGKRQTEKERKKERKRKKLRRFIRMLSQCELIAKSDNGNKNDNTH